MKLCRKQIQVKNGVSRGTCRLARGHRGNHGNKTCCRCGQRLTRQNVSPATLSRGYGFCRICTRDYVRRRDGHKPRNIQHAGQKHTFPCGCIGVLPQKSCQNLFVKHSYGQWPGFRCRISVIMSQSLAAAKQFDHKPIDPDTPHSVIRKMMKEPNCERCGEPLKWEFGIGKTPHLHHDHETGEIYGFTHPRCNSRALEDEIERLKKTIKRLKILLDKTS